jgi:predicted glycoside hydrolase/deacetylase ChbG (UPF0249 family)
MVRWPAAEHAVQHAGRLDLGLHIDLGEWAYRGGQWIARYQRVPLDDVRAVEAEVRSQLKEFQRLTERLPTHIDSHQHVHLQEPVLTVAKRLADILSVPLRRRTPRIRYCGDFYGQSETGTPRPDAISVSGLVALVGKLRPGITEMGCHPGEDEHLDSTYCHERFQEVHALCHREVRDTIETEAIQLTTFANLGEPSQ